MIGLNGLVSSRSRSSVISTRHFVSIIVQTVVLQAKALEPLLLNWTPKSHENVIIYSFAKQIRRKIHFEKYYPMF